MRAAWLGERRRQQLEPVCRKLRREREKESFRASCALQAFARSLSKAFQVSKASTGYGSFYSTKSSSLDMQKLARRTGLRLSECVCLETSFFFWFRNRKNTQNEFQTNSKHTQVAQHAGAWSGEGVKGCAHLHIAKAKKTYRISIKFNGTERDNNNNNQHILNMIQSKTYLAGPDRERATTTETEREECR